MQVDHISYPIAKPEGPHPVPVTVDEGDVP
jgi:hypothetical protein